MNNHYRILLLLNVDFVYFFRNFDTIAFSFNLFLLNVYFVYLFRAALYELSWELIKTAFFHSSKLSKVDQILFDEMDRPVLR
jgi:hypothetical protein